MTDVNRVASPVTVNSLPTVANSRTDSNTITMAHPSRVTNPFAKFPSKIVQKFLNVCGCTGHGMAPNDNDAATSTTGEDNNLSAHQPTQSLTHVGFDDSHKVVTSSSSTTAATSTTGTVKGKTSTLTELNQRGKRNASENCKSTVSGSADQEGNSDMSLVLARKKTIPSSSSSAVKTLHQDIDQRGDNVIASTQDKPKASAATTAGKADEEIASREALLSQIEHLLEGHDEYGVPFEHIVKEIDEFCRFRSNEEKYFYLTHVRDQLKDGTFQTVEQSIDMAFDIQHPMRKAEFRREVELALEARFGSSPENSALIRAFSRYMDSSYDDRTGILHRIRNDKFSTMLHCFSTFVDSGVLLVIEIEYLLEARKAPREVIEKFIREVDEKTKKEPLDIDAMKRRRDEEREKLKKTNPSTDDSNEDQMQETRKKQLEKSDVPPSSSTFPNSPHDSNEDRNADKRLAEHKKRYARLQEMKRQLEENSKMG